MTYQHALKMQVANKFKASAMASQPVHEFL
jgi:hypothetical protein